MSGTVFLEEVISWDEQKRRERVEEALPQLINYLQKHHSYEEAVGILQILSQAFIPLVSQEDLEQKVFNCVSQQISELVDALLDEIHRTVQKDKETSCEQLIPLLQHISGVLECVEECVKHVFSLPDAVQVSQVRSLLHCCLHVLQGSYGHCQESSELYGDRLPPLSDSLTAVFRKAHSLQMAFLNMLEKLKIVGSADEEDIQEITNVCEGLYSLCRLVACLEMRLTVSLWKALSKLLMQHQETVCPRLDLCGIVSYLCEEIHKGVAQLLESAPPASEHDEVMLSQGDDKAFTKSVKILNFQLKVLVAIVKDCCSYLSACVPNIHSVMLHLNSIAPPCLTAARLQTKHEEMVQQQLCYAVQPLTSHLLTSAAFRECILKKEAMDDDKCLPHLLLQMTAMNCLNSAPEELKNEWLGGVTQTPSTSSSNDNILAAVFDSMEKCHVEICLPVSITSAAVFGNPARTISLYQHAVENICGFISSCPAKYFHVVEGQLLSTLLNPNPISSQAAADTWCFVARCGTPQLCFQHAQFLLGLCKKAKTRAPFSSHIRCLTSLIGCLVKYLTPEHQTELLAAFPPAENVALWSDIDLSGLNEKTAGDTVHRLVMSAVGVVKHFAQLPNPSVADAVKLVPSLKCLHNIVRLDSTTHHLSPQLGASILTSVKSLWEVWPVDQPLPPVTTPPDGRGLCHLYLAALVTLTSDTVDQLDAKLLLQVLVVCHKALSGQCLLDVPKAVVQFLESVGPVRLPPSFEQGQILRKLADTFALVLSHEDPIVQYSALKAFTHFAEQTAYEAVVPECLAQKPGLQEKVTAFLQKVPCTPEGQNFDSVAFLRQQRDRYRSRIAAIQASTTAASKFLPSHETEGPRKRQRMTDTTDWDQTTGYQTVTEELECVVLKMEKLRVKEPVPEWVVVRSKVLLQRLEACLDR